MAVQEALLGKDFPVFVGNRNLSPELVSWRNIRDSFLQYPTEHSIERIIGLQLAAEALEKDGINVGLLVGGSLAVGQSESYSDIDVYGVVTREENAGTRKIIEAYQKKLAQEIGRHIEFPVVAETWDFNLEKMRNFIESADFSLSIMPNASALATFNLCDTRLFHVDYQTALLIGNCGNDLIGKIEGLKSDPLVVRALHPAFTLNGLEVRFNYSFNKYNARLSGHPVFSALEKSEQEAFMDVLTENENQFLFYIANPQFCTYP